MNEPKGIVASQAVTQTAPWRLLDPVERKQMQEESKRRQAEARNADRAELEGIQTANLDKPRHEREFEWDDRIGEGQTITRADLGRLVLFIRKAAFAMSLTYLERRALVTGLCEPMMDDCRQGVAAAGNIVRDEWNHNHWDAKDYISWPDSDL